MVCDLESYQRFLDGDNNGLAEILYTYRDGLILYIQGIVCNLDIAEDLAEDVFVKLALKRPALPDRAKFKTWLYTIGRNKAIDYLRRSPGRVVSLEVCSELGDGEEDLEQAYIQQEKRIAIHRCMKKLKPDYRQVLWLAYFEGFTYRQIGKILRKTPHSVETVAYRARLALKKILIEEDLAYEDI